MVGGRCCSAWAPRSCARPLVGVPLAAPGLAWSLAKHRERWCSPICHNASKSGFGDLMQILMFYHGSNHKDQIVALWNNSEGSCG